MDKLVSEVGGAVVGRQDDLHLPLGVAQLCVEGNAAFAGQVGVGVRQKRAQHVLHRVGVAAEHAHDDPVKQYRF